MTLVYTVRRFQLIGGRHARALVLGLREMGRPQGGDLERFAANVAALRDLINSGSPRVVRDQMVGGAISGARRRYPVPDIGHRSGKLTITGYLRGIRGGFGGIIVRCDCGQPEYTVDPHNFKNFKSTRCNACAKEAARQKRYWAYSQAMADDGHRTRLLNRLAAAITRCHSPTCRTFKHYGGRGIRVHPEWRADRASFLRYVQTLSGWDDPSLEMDRRDTNGHYEPGNIRFVTRGINMGNRRRIEDLEAEISRLRQHLGGAMPLLDIPD